MFNLPPEKLVELMMGKYVRLSDGTYRFCDIYTNHKDLVQSNETPVSAAWLRFLDGQMKIVDSSSTLRMGPCDADYTELPAIFNHKLVDQWE